MGYSTEFFGRFLLNKELDDDLCTYLKKFSETRRMKRDPKKLEEMGYGDANSFGVEGEYFVEGKGDFGQDRDESIVEYNESPLTQPGLWCQWIPSEDRFGIEWDRGEKFYYAAEWIQYIIFHFLAPNGYILNGIVNAEGEEYDDRWHIHIIDNKVHQHDYISDSQTD